MSIWVTFHHSWRYQQIKVGTYSEPVTEIDPSGKISYKVRLAPAILDPIITTLACYYIEPVTKPPIQNDDDKNGKPSDHLVVIMKPLSSSLEILPRKYKVVTFGPLPQSGMEAMRRWIQTGRIFTV